MYGAYNVSVPEPEAVVMMLAAAAGEVDEDGLARWIAP
jgi:hypothetical protein